MAALYGREGEIVDTDVDLKVSVDFEGGRTAHFNQANIGHFRL